MPNRPPKRKNSAPQISWGAFQRRVEGKDYNGALESRGALITVRDGRRHAEERVGMPLGEIAALEEMGDLLRDGA